MFAKIENWLTLGGQYTAAAVVYFGIALILGGSTLLDSSQALATDGEGCSYTVYVDQEGELVLVTYDGCPEGEQCCGDICISDSNICCEDGTYGDADTCACLCCEDCDADSLTTIMCDDE